VRKATNPRGLVVFVLSLTNIKIDLNMSTHTSRGFVQIPILVTVVIIFLLTGVGVYVYKDNLKIAQDEVVVLGQTESNNNARGDTSTTAPDVFTQKETETPATVVEEKTKIEPTKNSKVPIPSVVAHEGFVCGKSTVKDVDANVYNTVKIGNQCWMKQNMRVGTRVNLSFGMDNSSPSVISADQVGSRRDPPSNQKNNSVIEKYCYYDVESGEDPDANCTTNHPNQPDGGLYQWDEAMQYSTTEGARGICPAGWHIPTHDEFTMLERAVCTSSTCDRDFPYDTTSIGYSGTDENTKLTPNGISGFEGNASGKISLVPLSRGEEGFFWSSSQSGDEAWYRFLEVLPKSYIKRSTENKFYAFSVRCLKD